MSLSDEPPISTIAATPSEVGVTSSPLAYVSEHAPDMTLEDWAIIDGFFAVGGSAIGPPANPPPAPASP